MAHIKGTLFACLGAVLIAVSAAALKIHEPDMCAAPEKTAFAPRMMVIF